MVVAPNQLRLPLRVGLVGLGRWGSRYVTTLQGAPGYELAILCDTDPAARARARQAFSLPIGSSVDDALDAGVDAVVLATPLLTHAPLGLRCLERGRHVLVEKPLATTAAAARSLVAAADRSERCLLVGHLTLHHPAFQHLLAVVRAGGIGELTYVQAERTSASRQAAEPVLWALGPHDVAAFATLASTAEGVPAVTHLEASTLDEQTTVTLRLSTGVRASFLWRRCTSPQVRKLTVTGTEGSLTLDELTGEVTGRTRAGRAHPRAGATRLESSRHAVGPGSLLGLQCEHFLQCIQEKSVPMSGPIAVATVAILASADAKMDARVGRAEGSVECQAPISHPNRDETLPRAMSRV